MTTVQRVIKRQNKASYQIRQILELFCHVNALILDQNSVKDLGVTKQVKEIKFEEVWSELESKKKFPETKNYKISETNSNFHLN